MARERWRDVSDSVAYAVCLHWTLYRGRSYHWWSVIKKFTFIYSLLANVFLRTYLQRAIQFPVVPKPIHQNVRHIVMLFFDELPLVNANYVLQPPQPQSSLIGNACSRKPVCSVAEELYQHSVIIQLSLLLSSRLPLFLLSDSMYEGILKCNDHETYLLSLALNNAIYPTNLR